MADLILRSIPLFTYFDKGHRNGSDFLVKELGWLDEDDKLVKSICLQSDAGSGITSKDAAMSWDVVTST